MTENNKELVRRYLDELHNKQNFAIADELVGTTYGQHNPHLTADGMSGVARSVQAMRTAYPDYRLVIEHQISEGDLVASWGHFEGTNTGSYKGHPPTGNQVEFSAMFIHRVNDGKIVETWNGSDRLHQLQQLGLYPIDS